jgi:hypothetical protein
MLLEADERKCLNATATKLGPAQVFSELWLLLLLTITRC